MNVYCGIFHVSFQKKKKNGGCVGGGQVTTAGDVSPRGQECREGSIVLPTTHLITYS